MDEPEAAVQEADATSTSSRTSARDTGSPPATRAEAAHRGAPAATVHYRALFEELLEEERVEESAGR